MRKTMILVIALFLVLLSLTACSNSKAANSEKLTPDATVGGTGQQQNNNAAASDSINSGVQQTDGANVRISEQSWPTSKLYDVPEWEGITQYNGGGSSLDDYVNNTFSMIVVAEKDSLVQYLDLLKSKGWTISKERNPDGDRAELGAVSIRIVPSAVDGNDAYQVDISLREIGSWPKEELPGFLFPLEGKEMAGGTVYHKPDDDLSDGYTYLADSDGYNLVFEYTGLTKDEATAYIKSIAGKLKGGEYSSGGIADAYGNIKGTFDWKGDTYNVSGEVTEMDAKTYSFAFGWSTGEVY